MMNYVHTEHFSILKSTLIAIRGVRGKQRRGDVPISEISVNLIPERSALHVELRRMQFIIDEFFFRMCYSSISNWLKSIISIKVGGSTKMDEKRASGSDMVENVRPYLLNGT